MQSPAQAGELYWLIIEKLIIAHMGTPAAHVAFHGHNRGTLRHYMPLGLDGMRGWPLSEVNLEGCGTETVIVILLAWALSLNIALRDGYEMKAEHVTFKIGMWFSYCIDESFYLFTCKIPKVLKHKR